MLSKALPQVSGVSRRDSRRVLGVVLTGVVLAAAAVTAGLVTAAPAAAHSQLIASTPAADETLDALPPEFSVTMNEELLDLAGDASGFALQVIDPAGQYYGDGCLTIAGPTLSMAASLGEPGAYRFVYQVVSADGHPVSGEFAFTWAGEPTGPGSAQPPVCGEAVTTFPPTPTATPTPEPTADATAEPTAEPGENVGATGDLGWLPIALSVIGILAVGAVIAYVLVRRHRAKE